MAIITKWGMQKLAELFAITPKLAQRLAKEEMELMGALVEHRVSSGLTYADVANRLSWSERTVAEFESGTINPTLSQIRSYCLAVGIYYTAQVHFSEEMK